MSRPMNFAKGIKDCYCLPILSKLIDNKYDIVQTISYLLLLTIEQGYEDNSLFVVFHY